MPIQDAPEDLVPYLPDHLVRRSLTGEVGRPASSAGTTIRPVPPTDGCAISSRTST